MRSACALVMLAACGRVEFTTAPREASAITLTADNGYLLALGNGDQLGSEIANVYNDGEVQIAECAQGPERWELGLSATLYLYAWDLGNARGVRAQLETPDGPEPLELFALDACAGTFDGDPSADPHAAAQTLLAQCADGTAAASGTWIGEGGKGHLDTGNWDNGYPTCPGVFTDASHWLWWTDGTFDPTVSGTGPNEILLRAQIIPP